jgi:bacteriocin-like protein
MEAYMTKASKPAAKESLVKASKDAAVELSESELQQVSGGKPTKGQKQEEYFKVTMEDLLVSSY